MEAGLSHSHPYLRSPLAQYTEYHDDDVAPAHSGWTAETYADALGSEQQALGGEGEGKSQVEGKTDSPPEWQKLFDDTHQCYYYWNTLTGQSQWERPDDFQGDDLLAEASTAPAADTSTTSLNDGEDEV